MTRILVTDDDPAVRSLLLEVLKDAGYLVEGASDGDAALAALRTDTFDLVNTDLFMPRKDGIELLMEIRAHHAHLPIIAVSGGSPGLGLGVDLLKAAQRLGAAAVLRKPVRCADLL